MDADHEAEAKSMLQHLGIKVVNGYRYLGGFIGDRETTKQFLDNKITGWVIMNNLVKLSKVAESQPQADFAALSKSMQFEWSYLQRILPSCEEAFTPIWNTLYQYFWPAIFEGTISDLEKQLFSIPARLGGMGVRNPIKTAKIAYKRVGGIWNAVSFSTQATHARASSVRESHYNARVVAFLLRPHARVQ